MCTFFDVLEGLQFQNHLYKEVLLISDPQLTEADFPGSRSHHGITYTAQATVMRFLWFSQVQLFFSTFAKM